MIGVTLAQTTFTAPHISYSGLSPMLVVWSAATVGVSVEAVVPRAYRWLTDQKFERIGRTIRLYHVPQVSGDNEGDR